jgi:hypothetical protein
MRQLAICQKPIGRHQVTLAANRLCVYRYAQMGARRKSRVAKVTRKYLLARSYQCAGRVRPSGSLVSPKVRCGPV